jgi:hypothetical protein
MWWALHHTPIRLPLPWRRGARSCFRHRRAGVPGRFTSPAARTNFTDPPQCRSLLRAPNNQAFPRTVRRLSSMAGPRKAGPELFRLADDNKSLFQWPLRNRRGTLKEARMRCPARGSGSDPPKRGPMAVSGRLVAAWALIPYVRFCPWGRSVIARQAGQTSEADGLALGVGCSPTSSSPVDNTVEEPDTSCLPHPACTVTRPLSDSTACAVRSPRLLRADGPEAGLPVNAVNNR